jgi:methanethiol oxidase
MLLLKPDVLRVVDLEANSPTYGQFVHTLELPYVGDALHHFGWNACSALHHRDDGAGVRP